MAAITTPVDNTPKYRMTFDVIKALVIASALAAFIVCMVILSMNIERPGYAVPYDLNQMVADAEEGLPLPVTKSGDCKLKRSVDNDTRIKIRSINEGKLEPCEVSGSALQMKTLWGVAAAVVILSIIVFLSWLIVSKLKLSAWVAVILAVPLVIMSALLDDPLVRFVEQHNIPMDYFWRGCFVALIGLGLFIAWCLRREKVETSVDANARTQQMPAVSPPGGPQTVLATTTDPGPPVPAALPRTSPLTPLATPAVVDPGPPGANTLPTGPPRTRSTVHAGPLPR